MQHITNLHNTQVIKLLQKPTTSILSQAIKGYAINLRMNQNNMNKGVSYSQKYIIQSNQKNKQSISTKSDLANRTNHAHTRFIDLQPYQNSRINMNLNQNVIKQNQTLLQISRKNQFFKYISDGVNSPNKSVPINSNIIQSKNYLRNLKPSSNINSFHNPLGFSFSSFFGHESSMEDQKKIYDPYQLSNLYDFEHLKNEKSKSKQENVKVVFVRHGQSTWNSSGKFSGWVDIPLTEKGRDEARIAGKQLKEQGFHFDIAYTSMLDRAIETCDLILEEMGIKHSTYVHKSWRLNERHYGALQGLDKKQVGEKYGKEQLDLWRKSFDTPPPQLSYNDYMHPRFDKLYAHLSEEEHKMMPLSESLEQCKARVQPYWNEQIMPTLKNLEGGKTVLFVAHKHVLRSLVQQFAGIDNKSIKKLFIPNACPFIFEFDKSDEHKPVKNYYIDDLDTDVLLRAKKDDANLE